MISSPGSGLQHFESFTRQLSIPFTTMPLLDGLFFVSGFIIQKNTQMTVVQIRQFVYEKRENCTWKRRISPDICGISAVADLAIVLGQLI